MRFDGFQYQTPAHPKRELKLVPNAATPSSAKWAAVGAMISRRCRHQPPPVPIASVQRVWRKQFSSALL
jgi:hypothetical protein